VGGKLRLRFVRLLAKTPDKPNEMIYYFLRCKGKKDTFGEGKMQKIKKKSLRKA